MFALLRKATSTSTFTKSVTILLTRRRKQPSVKTCDSPSNFTFSSGLLTCETQIRQSDREEKSQEHVWKCDRYNYTEGNIQICSICGKLIFTLLVPFSKTACIETKLQMRYRPKQTGVAQINTKATCKYSS